MKKIFFLSIVCTFLLMASSQEKLRAEDNYYLLNKGNIARDMGNLQEAVSHYEDYISSHPFSSAAYTSRRYRNRSQYYLRNLLITYGNLLDILRDTGDTDKTDLWLEKLKETYSIEFFGAKNTYNLARILKENNCLADCLPLLEGIVEEQRRNYHPHNNKVALRAFAKLMDIYTKQGETDKQSLLCQTMERSFQQEYDSKDIYKLATTYLKYPPTKEKGEQLLERLLISAGEFPFSEEVPTLINAASRLMQLKSARNDQQGLTNTIEQCRTLLNNNLSPHNQYKLAVAFLQSGEKADAIQLLTEISEQYQQTVWARKSLFLLGREAMSQEHWDRAIDYYSSYIQRYPEQTFFSLKAYSTMLDAYWARDRDFEQQVSKIEEFANIINQVTDYETQLNLSRDLSRKGFDQLAAATFQLGHSAAIRVAEQQPNSLVAMRAKWQITKYASELGQDEIARKNGLQVLAQHKKMKLKSAEKQRADHYLSRTYLWLAKNHERHEQYPQAKAMLSRFAEEFPTDRDSDYVKFELGRLHEETREFEKAAGFYRQIKAERWKKKALPRLQRMTEK